MTRRPTIRRSSVEASPAAGCLLARYVDSPQFQSMREALGWVKDRYDALLVGIAVNGNAFELNPPSDRVIAVEDQLLVVAHKLPVLAAISA